MDPHGSPGGGSLWAVTGAGLSPKGSPMDVQGLEVYVKMQQQQQKKLASSLASPRGCLCPYADEWGQLNVAVNCCPQRGSATSPDALQAGELCPHATQGIRPHCLPQSLHSPSPGEHLPPPGFTPTPAETSKT